MKQSFGKCRKKGDTPAKRKGKGEREAPEKTQTCIFPLGTSRPPGGNPFTANPKEKGLKGKPRPPNVCTEKEGGARCRIKAGRVEGMEGNSVTREEKRGQKGFNRVTYLAFWKR